MYLILKNIVKGTLAGLMSGTLILGLGGRLLMRGIAILAGGSGSFSWAGSGEVVALGSIIGICSGAFLGLSSPFAMRNKLIWGMLHGALAYIMVLVLPIGGKGAARGFPDLQVTIHLLFGGSFLLFGIAMVWLFIKFHNSA